MNVINQLDKSVIKEVPSLELLLKTANKHMITKRPELAIECLIHCGALPSIPEEFIQLYAKNSGAKEQPEKQLPSPAEIRNNKTTTTQVEQQHQPVEAPGGPKSVESVATETDFNV